jgi:hypothetical protein
MRGYGVDSGRLRGDHTDELATSRVTKRNRPVATDATSLSSSGENAAAWNTCFELVTCGPIASEIWPRSPRYMSAALIHRWVRMLAT